VPILVVGAHARPAVQQVARVKMQVLVFRDLATARRLVAGEVSVAIAEVSQVLNQPCDTDDHPSIVGIHGHWPLTFSNFVPALNDPVLVVFPQLLWRGGQGEAATA
jgi:hypothetical protein